MKKFLLPFLMICAFSKAQTFIVNDVLVSSNTAQLGDVEFDPYKKRISWQTITASGSELWVCDLDTNTWALKLPDGKGTLIDNSIIPLFQSFNSGEWAFSQAGTSIVYGKLISNTPYIAVAEDNLSSWSVTTATINPNRFNPRATKTLSDPIASVQYVTVPGTMITKYKNLNNLNGVGSESTTSTFSDAHWADDEKVLTGILTNSQVALFDPTSPTSSVQITFDATTNYTRPYMWRAPDQGNARMFFAKANSNEIRVFKETAVGTNSYVLYTQFTSPSSNPTFSNIASPEPIVYDGKSYITFMASKSALETSNALAEIWIREVNTNNPMVRKVSDNVDRVRTDPEPFPTKDELLIYYTNVNDSIDAGSIGTIDPTTVLRLRKCKTGISKKIVGINEQQFNYRKLEVYPNPFINKITINNLIGDETFTLTNVIGETIFEGKNIQDEDFSNLDSGLYLLKVQSSKLQYQTIKLLKN